MLNEKEIIKQVEDLLKGEDKEAKIEVNALVGIDETNELVYIETISLAKYTNNVTLGVYGGTYRPISTDDIEERTGEDWAYEERDLWVQAVESDRTDEGLLEWWQECCEGAEMEGLLYPFDDNSDREEIEEAYKKLTQKQKDKIEEIWGTKGNYEDEWDTDENLQSNWYTVTWGLSGSVINRNGHYADSPETAKGRVEEWKVNLYPELINFLAETIDELAEKEEVGV